MKVVPISIVVLCLWALPTAFATQPVYLARRDYPVAASGLVAADTNGDGIVDIIYSHYPDADVLLGNGAGAFRSGPTSNIGAGFGVTPVAQDLNGDGNVDLIFSTTLGAAQVGFAVCFGNGDGTFQRATFYQAGTNLYVGSAILADFNGDGIPDVVVNASSGIWFFPGKGAGVFGSGVLTPMSQSDPWVAAAADFNGDRKLDLAVATQTGFNVLLGNGDGTFKAPRPYTTTPLSGYWIAAADLTGNGHADIVLAAFATDHTPNYVLVYPGNGKGGFAQPLKVEISPVEQIAIHDVNGDHIPDLVGSGGFVALGNGDGTFQKPTQYPVPQGGLKTYLAVADMLNNGLTDLAFVDGDSSISVLINIGNGKFEDGEWTPVPGGAGCGAAADYNGDGHPDLAVNTPSGVSILLGTGKASHPFKTGATITLTNAGCLVSGDLNNDGIPDLLVPSDGTVVAYLGKGDGTFTESSVTSTLGGGYLAVGDFNHDGKLDFATSGGLLALGNGDGTFQTPTDIIPGACCFASIAVADLNGDGWADLALTDTVYSYVDVLLNNQQGGFNLTQIDVIIDHFGVQPTQVVLAPLRKQGPPDILLATYSGGAIIYTNNGSGAFTFAEQLFSPSITASGGDILAVADLNGDGIPDLLMAEGDNDRTLGILLGNGNGTFTTAYYAGAGFAPGDILLENLHGQPACSGSPDIVAPDVTGGVMVLIDLTVAKCPGL